MVNAWNNSWYFALYLDQNTSKVDNGAKAALKVELHLLLSQKCAYCSGFGHSGNDCPTDHKLSLLRLSTSANRVLITTARKEARLHAGMATVTRYSLLSASAGRLLRKRKWKDSALYSSDSSNGFGKRRKPPG